MKNYTENDIRVAAYYNWLNSGCQNGNDLQNWNNAMQQLSNNINTASKTASASKSFGISSLKSKTCACKKTTTSKKSGSKKSK